LVVIFKSKGPKNKGASDAHNLKCSQSGALDPAGIESFQFDVGRLEGRAKFGGDITDRVSF
jgi:hypothetical protein